MAAFLAALFSVTSAAEGSASPRVAIVAHSIGGAEGEFEAKVRAELLAAGFEVLTVFEPAATEPAPLERIAERTDSVATVSVLQPQGSLTADVWITDRVTGKVLLRHVRPERDSPDAPAIIAIRAVELLRASFMELNEAHAPRGDVPAPSRIRAWVAPPTPSHESAPPLPRAWSAAAGIGVLGLPGGLPPSVAPAVSLGFRPLAAWSGELQLLGPATGSVETPSGSAEFQAELVTLRAAFEVLSGENPLVPRLVGGAGVFHLRARGNAVDPLVASAEDAWVAHALLGAGVRARITPFLSAVGEVDLFVAAAQPVLRFAGQPAARAGRPGLLGALSLQVAW